MNLKSMITRHQILNTRVLVTSSGFRQQNRRPREWRGRIELEVGCHSGQSHSADLRPGVLPLLCDYFLRRRRSRYHGRATPSRRMRRGTHVSRGLRVQYYGANQHTCHSMAQSVGPPFSDRPNHTDFNSWDPVCSFD